MSEHTQEPWVVGETTHEEGQFIETVIRALEGIAGIAVCVDFGFSNPDMREANARRIVACVNACAGISTKVLETLEDKTLNEMYKRQETEYQAQRDRLLTELKHSTNILYDEGIYNGQVHENLAVINDVESSK
jgi:hypothetical protein